MELMEYDDVYIELVEAVPTSSKEELNRKEGEWIRKTPNAVNRCVAGRTSREYKKEHPDRRYRNRREYQREYRRRLKTECLPDAVLPLETTNPLSESKSDVCL